MTKANEIATAFLRKAQDEHSSKSPAPRSAINAFQALFSVQELEERESSDLERVFFAGVDPEGSCESDINKDLAEIKRLTKELKAIKRQELVLIGERVAQARDVFRSYKKRSFREWLELTFGSYKTGYNYLSFFDLYSRVPEELKATLKGMPAKAIYILASKKGPLETKVQLVKECAKNDSRELIEQIRSAFEEPARKISKPKNERSLRVIEREASLLVPDNLDQFQKKRILELINHLKDLIS